MNKKATTINTVLIFMIVVVITSAVVLSLIKFGVIETNPEYEQVQVLNTEFVPLEKSGDITVVRADFCGLVDQNFTCYNQAKSYSRGGKVFLRFVVETTPYQGNILLSRNYKVRSPSNNVVLELANENAYIFEIESTKEREQVVFADVFTLPASFEQGEYVFEIVVENPLLNKKTTLVKRVNVQ